MDKIIIIDNIDQIDTPNVKYAHNSKPSKWITIEYEDLDNEYCIRGMISGDSPTYVTTSNWNQVKVWKTFNGTVRALNIYSKNGGWGMSHWNNNN